jgi:hypothetical protein
MYTETSISQIQLEFCARSAPFNAVMPLPFPIPSTFHIPFPALAHGGALIPFSRLHAYRLAQEGNKNQLQTNLGV